jgi:hypothetical protein
MVKLSPPRFYLDISCNFDITCNSGWPNLILVNFSNFAPFSLEYGENHLFWQLSVGKTTPKKIFKIHSFFFLSWIIQIQTVNSVTVIDFNLKLEI